MAHSNFSWAGVAAVLFFAVTARAAKITIDMNGFPDASGGAVSGPGLEKSIPLPAGEQKVVLENLQNSQTYQVDFFHNSGPGSSDFTFTVNAAGTGVDAVTLGGDGFAPMVTGFKPGDNTLKLNTHAITYNENGGQTGPYYIHGLTAPLKSDSPPQKFAAVPGSYHVDNLYNSGDGNEDYNFIVDANGKVSADPKYAPYAQLDGSSVKPRAVLVHFRLEGSAPISYHTTQTAGSAKSEGTVFEFDMPMTIGSSGVNVWSFGKFKVTKGDATRPDDTPLEGATRDNDFYFYPRVLYTEKDGFVFKTTSGTAKTVTAEAEGTFDDGTTPLTVKASATIVKPYTTAPSAAPTTAPVPR